VTKKKKSASSSTRTEGVKIKGKGPEWNLKKLFYSSFQDPHIEKDIALGERAVDAFVKKYSTKKDWLSSPKALRTALDESEKLAWKSSPAPMYFAFYRKDLNATDKDAEASRNRLNEIYAKRGNKLLFFDLELARVPEKIQKRFLKAPELAGWRYHLKRLFETAKYNLSEKEERVLSLFDDVSFGRWIQTTENMLNVRTVYFDGKDIPINEALVKLNTLPTTQRRRLWKMIAGELRTLGEVAEGEINAIVTEKKITDELRGFKQPHDATILGYENEKESVLALIKTVTENFDISRRFYALKARLLKEKTLTYADRAAQIGGVRENIPFDTAFTAVKKAFERLHPRYAEVLDRLREGGQVDAYPRLGKTGGAYCSGGISLPTMVLLNHQNDTHSLLTLAHEMGHAIHTERSKTQRPIYQGYSTVTAETASTFFEGVAFDALMEVLPENARTAALHDRLQDDIQTVFRQIACFNFETDMHRQIRDRGLLTKEELAALMNHHMETYLGETVRLTEDDGYFFVAWSHIRRFFYVYSYAYGQLVSRALRERVKKDSSFIHNIDKNFLSVGGSASPEDIFAACGLDVRSPHLFREGLLSMEKDMERLENAVHTMGKH